MTSKSSNKTYQDKEDINANSLRAHFRCRKSLAFIKPVIPKGDHPNNPITLETLCRPVRLGRELYIPPLVCDLILFIEHNGIESENLYRRPNDLTSRPNYSSMFETLLDSGPESFDCRSASLLARKMLKVVSEEYIDHDSQANLSKSIEAWDCGAVHSLINTVKSIISNSSVNRCYKDTLAFMCIHLSHLNLVNKTGKGDRLSQLVESFTGVFRIKEKILKFLITNADEIFEPIEFSMKNISKIECCEEIEENIDINYFQKELQRKESLLTMLITEVNKESDTNKDEMLWTVQREITQIKRKLKRAHAPLFASSSTSRDTSAKLSEEKKDVDAKGSDLICDSKLPNSKSMLLGQHMLQSLQTVRDEIYSELNNIRQLESDYQSLSPVSTKLSSDNAEQLSSKLAQLLIDNNNLHYKIELMKNQIEREQKAIDQCVVELKWQDQHAKHEKTIKHTPVLVDKL
ncbi:hypothetical protein GJ496_005532 [Pomphorhynchus laevis]|nr:hypothetical protein GJ496_005532 [Pomphorhynchus laevis]